METPAGVCLILMTQIQRACLNGMECRQLVAVHISQPRQLRFCGHFISDDRLLVLSRRQFCKIPSTQQMC